MDLKYTIDRNHCMKTILDSTIKVVSGEDMN